MWTRVARLSSRGRDVVHLPVVLSATTATVGPVIAPGLTACLSCLDATRRREDASWPLIAAQLLARAQPDTDVTLAAEAARAARHLVSGRIDSVTRSLELRADSLQRVGEPIGRAKTAAADLSKKPRRRPLRSPATTRPAHRQRSRGPRDADVRQTSFLVDGLECLRVRDRQQALTDPYEVDVIPFQTLGRVQRRERHRARRRFVLVPSHEPGDRR